MGKTALAKKIGLDWYFYQLAFEMCTGRINPPHEGVDRRSDVWPCQMVQAEVASMSREIRCRSFWVGDFGSWAAQGRESDAARITVNVYGGDTPRMQNEHKAKALQRVETDGSVKFHSFLYREDFSCVFTEGSAVLTSLQRWVCYF